MDSDSDGTKKYQDDGEADVEGKGEGEDTEPERDISDQRVESEGKGAEKDAKEGQAKAIEDNLDMPMKREFCDENGITNSHSLKNSKDPALIISYPHD